jgi:diaminopropionate ammonia-lyase
MSSRSYVRSSRATPRRTGGLFDPPEYARVGDFWRHEGPAIDSPLVALPGLAARLGLEALYVKDESRQPDVKAFKIVGVSYAMSELEARGRLASGARVVAATAGNHGRAVARAARLRGLQSHIYVPRDTVPARIQALEREGARVRVSQGAYEQAVREAADDAARFGWEIVSDTSWPGYTEVPRWIMAGYTRIVQRAVEALPAEARPDVVIVQGGVGGLVCAVASWLSHKLGPDRPYTMACEPSAAPSLLETARAGAPVVLPSLGATTMNGLHCAEVSPLAWEGYRDAIDAYVAIDDVWAFKAMRALARPIDGDAPVEAGASGACGLGALLALLRDPALADARTLAGLDERPRVLLFNTEGATDPDLYTRIVSDAAFDLE